VLPYHKKAALSGVRVGGVCASLRYPRHLPCR
jgi:hypothetical protein